MAKLNRFYPLLIYLVGLGVVLKYILTTNYLNGATVSTEFALYMFYAGGGEWRSMVGSFGLQNSCLPVAFLPAMLQNFTGIEPVLFYKGYHALILPFLPVVAYFIFRRFVSNHYAAMGVLFVFGTVTYLQSPSMARTTIALIFYGLLLLVVFSPGMKYRLSLAVVLSVLLVLSHYTTTYLAMFIFAGALVFGLVRWLGKRKGASQLVLVFAILITLSAGSLVWYGAVNSYAFDRADARVSAISDTPQGIADVGTRDKIIQAAFGVKHPDGDTVFQFNWWLFGISWLVILLIVWGMVKALLKRDLPLEFLAMSAMCFILLAITVLVPGASRGYGIERVFYQCTPMFGVLLVKGLGNPGRYSWAILLPLILAYGYLNMNYGVIHSITGG